ncbi:ABC transporter substrate-binding protein [Photobacterium leiognathi subsp. mandapamensis]|nr:ABC transporter substrate-binding protein [Photobacterium leiognathi subsp. mandapamensis]
MTPQEKDLIQSVATKLKQSPESKKDADAEKFIADEIASQPDAIYKLTQAVLVQEMALKQLKEKNDYLEKNAEYYKEESNRGSLSRMFGGSRPAPQPPQPPVRQPSAFGGFMQTAAGVAAGMVAGSVISNMLFDHDQPAETAAADPAPAADPTADATQDATPDTAAADTTADQSVPTDDVANPAFDDQGSFLDNTANNFTSDYTGGFGNAGFDDNQSGFGDSGFGYDDNGFGDDDTYANNGFGGGDDSFLGGDDSGFGDFDDDL